MEKPVTSTGDWANAVSGPGALAIEPVGMPASQISDQPGITMGSAKAVGAKKTTKQAMTAGIFIR
jgi:hypothetical protein